MIRELRNLKGWSQTRLAAEAGLDRPATISELETGKKDNPELSTLMKIAAALGVSVRELFAPNIDDETENAIRLFGNLRPGDREVVLAMMARLSEQR